MLSGRCPKGLLSVVVIALGLVNLGGGIIGCSNQASPPMAPPDTASGPAVASAEAPPEAPSSTPAASPAESAAMAPPAVTGQPIEMTHPLPDSAQVMNNAQTAKDAGNSDRLQGITDVMTASRDKFRACFDAWAATHPITQETRVMFTIKLKPSGELISSQIKKSESDVTDATLESCMGELTRGLSFPASPSGKETTYNHPFRFKPKK